MNEFDFFYYLRYNLLNGGFYMVAIVAASFLTWWIKDWVDKRRYRKQRLEKDDQDIRRSIKNLEVAVRALLKNDITIIHKRNEEQGYSTSTEKESADTMYCSYKVLGGNGFVDSMIDDIMESSNHKKTKERGTPYEYSDHDPK